MVIVNGAKTRTLDVTDTLVHLIVHVHYLLMEGVGLRQLMDIVLFVNNHFDELDLTLLFQYLKCIEYEKTYNAYMSIAKQVSWITKRQNSF